MNHKKRDLTIMAVIAVIVVIMIAVGAASFKPHRVSFMDCLEEAVLTVDGQEYTLRELAFYIAYEERLVEEQAEIYSPEDTSKYWGLHTDGRFIKEAARDAAMDLAVHDFVFYAEAEVNGVKLTAEDKERLKLRQQDFWYDFSDRQQQEFESLRGDFDAALERMAYAQQQQYLYAAAEGLAYEDYGCGEPGYEQILQEHTYEIHTDVWDRLDFGNITLSH